MGDLANLLEAAAVAALARLGSVWLDHSGERYNLAGVAFEGGIALLLV